MGFTKRFLSVFSYKPKVNYATEVSSPTLINVKILKHHSVDCPCGNRAIPIGLSGNKYQCMKCTEQLMGTSYNFGHDITHDSSSKLPKDASQIMDMDFYDDSVSFLKSEKQRRW